MKLRNAFSLAEILVVVAILSVIAIFGFKIAGDGIDRAYNDYIYTGYEGLNVAIKAAEEAGIDPNEVPFNRYIAGIFNGSYINEGRIIRASNGINYIARGRLLSPNPIFFYQMQTPKRRADDGSTVNNTCLAYYPNEDYNLLLPVGTTDECTTDLDIQQRPDLLLFYFDDGTAGRTIGGVYQPIQYYTVRDAVCSKYGPDVPSGFVCTGINLDPDLANAFLRYAHPKRIATR